MIIRVTNKLWSIGGSSIVTDENNEVLFKVKGKMALFSPTRKKKIYNKEEKKVYTVRNKFWKWIFSFNSAIIYDDNGTKLGKLKQKLSRKNAFVLEGEYFDTISIGKEDGYRGFVIRKNDEIIASIRSVGIVRDNFEVECFKEEDLALIVALVIAIDNIRDKNYKDND